MKSVEEYRAFLDKPEHTKAKLVEIAKTVAKDNIGRLITNKREEIISWLLTNSHLMEDGSIQAKFGDVAMMSKPARQPRSDKGIPRKPRAPKIEVYNPEGVMVKTPRIRTKAPKPYKEPKVKAVKAPKVPKVPKVKAVKAPKPPKVPKEPKVKAVKAPKPPKVPKVPKVKVAKAPKPPKIPKQTKKSMAKAKKAGDALMKSANIQEGQRMASGLSGLSAMIASLKK